MIMVILIIIVVIIAVSTVVFFTKNKKKEVPYVSPSKPASSVEEDKNTTFTYEGFSLTAISTGIYADMNNSANRGEIKQLAITSKEAIDRTYIYSVDANYFSKFSGEQKIKSQGDIKEGASFTINGNTYYGITLAGAPDAYITKINNFKVVEK